MTTRRHLERDLLLVVCAISAGVHAALVREHLRESTVTGGGFIVAAAGLLALVVWLSRRPDDVLALVATARTLAAVLAGYALAVTTGIPVLHPDVDAVDRLALATKAVETLGLALALDLLRRPAAESSRPFPHRTEGARP